MVELSMGPVQGVPGPFESAALGAVSLLPVQRFRTWVSSYFRPVDIFRAEPASTSLWRAVTDAALAGFICGLVLGLILLLLSALVSQGGAAMGPAYAVFIIVIATVLFPIASLIGSAIYFIAAKLLGGKGSYSAQTFILTSILCGQVLLSLPFSILGMIPIAGMVFSLISWAIGVYALYSIYKAIKEVHQLSGGRAAAVALVPVLIAVVLVVALAGISLVGLMAFAPQSTSNPGIGQSPGLTAGASPSGGLVSGPSALESASRAYWSGEARPFAIADFSFFPGSGTLTLMNVEAGSYVGGDHSDAQLTLTSLEVSGCDAYAAPTEFASAEKKTLQFACHDAGVPAGSEYSHSIAIHYTSVPVKCLPDPQSCGMSYASNSTEYGAKELVGRLSG